MKYIKYLLAVLSLFLFITSINAQNEKKTTGDNSPIIEAKKVALNYGIRPEVIDRLIELYDIENGKFSVEKLENLIVEFSTLTKEEKELSPSTKQKLGVINPKLEEALEWQLFTQGANSPIIYSAGSVQIWYGIPQKTLLKIAKVLEARNLNLEEYASQIYYLTEKHKELTSLLKEKNSSDEIIKQVQKLIDEGEIEEAEKLLDGNKSNRTKKAHSLAFEDFITGKVKELRLKYNEAAKYYKWADDNHPDNPKYITARGENAYKRNDFKMAMEQLGKALAFDTISADITPEELAMNFKNYGDALTEMNKFSEATLYLNKALVIFQEILPSNHYKIIGTINSLGAVYIYNGAYQKSIALYEGILKEDVVLDEVTQNNLSLTNYHLGIAYFHMGNLDTALLYYQKSFAIDSILYFDKFGYKHPKLATTKGTIGILYSTAGMHNQALATYREVLYLSKQLYGENNYAVATQYTNIAAVKGLLGERDSAFHYYNLALDIDRKNLGEKNQRVALIYNNMANDFGTLGQYDSALVYINKGIAIYTDLYGEAHPKVSSSMSNKGVIYEKKGDLRKALPIFHKALSIDSLVFPENHPAKSYIHNSLGNIYNGLEEYEEAHFHLKKTLDLAIQYFGPLHHNTAMVSSNFGGLLSKMEKLDSAFIYFRKGFEIDSSLFGMDHLVMMYHLNNLGTVYADKEDYENGMRYIEKSLVVARNHLDENHPEIGVRLMNLGSYAAHLKKYEESEAYYLKAKTVFASLSADNHFSKQVVHLLEELYPFYGYHLFDQGDYEKAKLKFLQACDYSSQTQDTVSLFFNLYGLGATHQALGACDSTLVYFTQARQLLSADAMNVTLAKEQKEGGSAKYSIAKTLRKIKLKEASCLKQLNRKKEARKIFKALKNYAVSNQDTEMKEQLRAEGIKIRK